MLQYALYDYYPQRYHRLPYEQQELNRRILDFKAGRTYAGRWAAEVVGQALSANDLANVTIVCVPASCQRTYTRRYKRFLQNVCRVSGALNGFDAVHVHGHRCKAHHASSRTDRTQACQLDNVIIDEHQLQGSKVLVIDDVVTTGSTAHAFIQSLQLAGATVCGTLFLARTKSFRR